MTDKTQELYTLVLQRILEVMNEASPGEGTAAELVISDYEEAILSSFGIVFPGARVRGCWFHYGQVRLDNQKLSVF